MTDRLNAKTAKKLRKYTRKPWFEYVLIVRSWPFKTRLRFCWHILFARRRR